MNTLFKKHFWAVGLLGLALLALALSGIVSVLIGERFFAMPTPPAVAAEGDEEAAPETHGRLAVEVDAVADFDRRRIFTADWPEAAKPAPPPEETPEEKPEDAPAPADTLSPTKLPISLIGTFVAEDATYSFADLVVQGENKIASLGSTYLDGQATVVRIARGLVLFKESGGFTYVRVWDARDQSASAGVGPGDPGMNRQPGMPPGAGRPPPMPGAEGGPPEDGAGGDDGGAGVTKTGAYDYSVSRAMIDKELADPAKLQREARAVPHFKDNQYGGVKLVGVRPGSLYRTLGIRSGDIITGVNGIKIDNPGKALELVEQLRKSANISVDIERRGQPRQLNYTIQ